ncbi:putative zinc finger protein [Nocardioides albertanoniae]|uniref:Regulator of SigK n=1 Tax=Nocardioides albertanoniae TaxID=1175486 RepID=A0A543A9W6_9ACTN|nr:anti-sigma factor [Nocardioides albertanoniae]TQL69246.1 putative zinc finger protein [Nocardioides albertanoniae]
MAPEVHGLVGAYLLHAVEPGESADFEAHLALCSECREEVDSLRAPTAAMAEKVAATPPASLRDRVVRQASETAQLRPEVAGERHRRRWWLAGVVAAAAALVIGVGVIVGVDVGEDPAATTTAAEVLAAPDATMHKEMTTDGELMVAMSPEMHMVAVDTARLERPAGMTYQVWWHTEAGMESAGVLEEKMAVAVPVEDGDLMVTMEPMGGSERPSETVLLQMPAERL